jgi:hypothetical protein
VYAWRVVCIGLVIVCILFIAIDASVAEEYLEGGFYQEEEDYPRHFANQGKPSFES